MITGTRDPKICSEQERADQTLSEKLDQTNGGICPPDIDPGMKAPTPHAGSLRGGVGESVEIALDEYQFYRLGLSVLLHFLLCCSRERSAKS